MKQRFSTKELATCALREVHFRQRVYPRWVEQRRMTQQEADRELAMMQAVYDWLAGEPEQRRLL